LLDSNILYKLDFVILEVESEVCRDRSLFSVIGGKSSFVVFVLRVGLGWNVSIWILNDFLIKKFIIDLSRQFKRYICAYGKFYILVVELDNEDI
jgi:hypothetical protein